MALPRTVHLIGIGGTGMSGIAHCLLDAGSSVTGSDLSESDATRELRSRGATIHIGHAKENLGTVEMVVRSAAVPDANPEMVAARERDLPVLKYSEFLGRLMKEKRGIGVSGCHGKTTTTGMIAWVLERAGLEPSFVNGGVIPEFRRSAKMGAGKHFVAEACEYDRSFHRLDPACAVITNIEEDHLDYYSDLDEIVEAFRVFASKAEFVVGSADNVHSAKIVAEKKGEAFSLTRDADWRARQIAVEDGRWTFEVLKYGRAYGEYTLAVAGAHNVANALAAIAVGTWAGVGQEILQLALSEFRGVERRFQLLGERDDVLVIDDYGHHPTEIQATLAACKSRYPERKIWCVFQPHQHSRTRVLLRDFAKSFGDAHIVLLPEIYAARDTEKDKSAVSSQQLARLLDEAGKAALYLPTLDEVLAFVRSKIGPGSVLVTMGAGNVFEVARRFLSQ